MTTRRSFLAAMAALTSGIMLPWNPLLAGNTRDKWGKLLPLRKLGDTGLKVTMLGVGGYHVGWTTERDAQEVIETAMAKGIRFFDSAYSYGDGQSERRYGKYLVPQYRDDVFIMTKSTAKDYKTAREELEESLRRLKVDTVDLWQVHSIQSPEDVDIRIKNGVLKLAEEALKEGKARYIGFTGHANPYAHLRMLEQAGNSGLFSTEQFPINLVDFAGEHSFVKKVIPKAVEHNMGLLAMKTLADGRFFSKKIVNDRTIWETDNPVAPNQVSVRDALHFAWSLPISVLITGAENKKLLVEKIKAAKKFTEIAEAQRVALSEKLTAFAEAGKVEYYKDV
jgi:aryl-alcohol dehydrogenase-like predicted oxidoreductase